MIFFPTESKFPSSQSWFCSKAQFGFQKRCQLEAFSSGLMKKKKSMNLRTKSGIGEGITFSPKATLWYLQKKVPWCLCEDRKCKITYTLFEILSLGIIVNFFRGRMRTHSYSDLDSRIPSLFWSLLQCY